MKFNKVPPIFLYSTVVAICSFIVSLYISFATEIRSINYVHFNSGTVLIQLKHNIESGEDIESIKHQLKKEVERNQAIAKFLK